MDPIKEAPTDILCDAARTLQEAHDFVETNAFDINTHGNEEDSIKCCFIGSVHRVAGEYEVTVESVLKVSSHLALQALDLAAIRSGYPGVDWYGRPFCQGAHDGGIAEAQFKRLHYGLPENEQKEKALPFYREAIKEVQAELATREDIPVPA